MRAMNRGRPNSQLPFGSLERDAVLCCGEDLGEFKRAIKGVFATPQRLHSYRCYAFLKRRNTSFIWTGMGSGCLEPLLCEIFDEPNLQRIILVGTAGSVSKNETLGIAFPITEARVACAGISPKNPVQFPNWRLPKNEESRRIVSTDYYYGFTLRKNWPTPNLWSADTRLAKSVPRALRKSDLVDMETGQFYHLCRTLRPDLQYLALKGAANPLRDFTQQTLHSESVLDDALKKAKLLLTSTP